MFPKLSRDVLRVADSELAELKRTDLERRDWPEDGPQMFRISREIRYDMRTASGSNAPGKDLKACNCLVRKLRPKFRWLALYG